MVELSRSAIVTKSHPKCRHAHWSAPGYAEYRVRSGTSHVVEDRESVRRSPDAAVPQRLRQYHSATSVNARLSPREVGPLRRSLPDDQVDGKMAPLSGWF